MDPFRTIWKPMAQRVPSQIKSSKSLARRRAGMRSPNWKRRWPKWRRPLTMSSRTPPPPPINWCSTCGIRGTRALRMVSKLLGVWLIGWWRIGEGLWDEKSQHKWGFLMAVCLIYWLVNDWRRVVLGSWDRRSLVRSRWAWWLEFVEFGERLKKWIFGNHSNKWPAHYFGVEDGKRGNSETSHEVSVLLWLNEPWFVQIYGGKWVMFPAIIIWDHLFDQSNELEEWMCHEYVP